MKIMTDDEVAMDSMDTEEDIFSPRGRRSDSVRRLKSLRTLRSHSGSGQHSDRKNTSVRRSTRNRMQTYDNLNTSWILGTQTLKGYPMIHQHGSSSDKDIVDEVPDRKRDLRDRMPLRSRENHPLTRNSQRHMRDRTEHDRPVREKSDRDLRDKSDRDLRDKSDRDLRDKSDRDLRDKSDRDLREKTERDLRERPDHERELRDRVERDKESLRDLKETRNSKSETKTASEDKETSRTRKSDSPSRLREGPVTRLCNNLQEKDVKPKTEPNEEEEEDDSSRESDKPENNDNSDNDNDNGYEDMYSRVKRTRRTSKRQLSLRNQKLRDEETDSESDIPRNKYSLRQKKPTVDRFQASSEPVRRSMRALRSVLPNSMRRKLRNESATGDEDSSDSEPQIYDKKKKSRTPAKPQSGPTNRPCKADISPVTLDTNTRFDDVGGLQMHIECLKEMIVFPLMYSDVFDQFHVTPPKGVLFHGPPGTGKTLLARALANECSQGNQKVTFFMRKGADCLSKWVGESERQLRLLFDQAQQMKPSIIFFDEIDGFAPVRSTKQDQIHSSIVSTLLALMDGLNQRDQVIVIGATNRIDAIDPALRRPGRFDRELFFQLPAEKERLEILKIHVSKWKNTPSDELLQFMAEKTLGYCGSDLRALCTEAVIQGLRRTYPQIYRTSKRLLLDPKQVQVTKEDFETAFSSIVPSSQRVAPSIGKRLHPYTLPLLENILNELLDIIKGIFPQGVDHTLAKMKTVQGTYRPRLLITGGRIAQGQGLSLAQALIHHMEHIPVHTLDVSTLFSETARSPEETCTQVFNEASRCVPSIIYIRAIDEWWSLVSETVKAVILCRIAAIEATAPILILATSEFEYKDLPTKIRSLFSEFRSEVYTIKKPLETQRTQFFKPIFLGQCLKAPLLKRESVQVLEELPLAPDPIPKKLTEKEKKILTEKEETSLRELRIFLREICAKLAKNKQFYMFTKPVDTEQVPDYTTIIKRPMDLETMMTKIDMHSYLCAKEFLQDVDLICTNALEYNPDRDPADKLIRHRACSLRDNAYALIKAELDSDFEDRCREISANRKKRVRVSSTIHLDACVSESKTNNAKELTREDDRSEEKKDLPNSAIMNFTLNGRRVSTGKRKRGMLWARGFVKKPMKKKKISFEDDEHSPKNNSLSNSELQKLEDFESTVMNGHVNIADSDSENEVNEEATMKEKEPTPEQDIKDDKSESNDSEKDKHLSRKDSLDEFSFAFEELYTQEEDGEVEVDREELENALAETVRSTKNLTIEELCDVYVMLSRCVGKYAHTFQRKSLPKDLLKELEFRISRRLDTSSESDDAMDIHNVS